MTNSQIAKFLRNIAAAYTIKDEKKFRFQIIAYQRASDAVQNTTTELSELYKEKKLDTIPGIGPTIQSHLEELFKTGKVKHFDWVLKGIPEAVFPLLDVPTFGPKKAYKLVQEFKLSHPATVINDVLNLAKTGKIAKLEGFGEKSQSDILQAIVEYRLGKGKTTRMVLPYAADIAEKLVSYLKAEKAAVDVQPLGSLRRMAATVGDIDIAVATEKPKVVISHFLAYPYKERVIEHGDTTASILVSGGRQIDLMTQPPESFGSLLQHFTGSKNHNIKLREYAITKELSLSEYGIKKRTGQMRKYALEDAFYRALGMDWIPPEMREDQGEIELALMHKLPKLIEQKDIKGDLHLHSNFPIEPSHDMGQNSFAEMVKRAIELGYEYIGFSEHNPSISKHTKEQIYKILLKRKNAVERLKKAYKKIGIINLLEVDILTNGNLAIDDKALSTLDAAIVSIHSSFSMNKTQMTKRVLKGLSHPKAKILAHPTGRMLNQRPGYELDFDALFNFCKKHNKALEINAWPARLDLPDAIVKEAVKNNVKMVINTDSHATEQMELMKYGVAVARRGWATAQDIVNAWGFTKFSKWLTI